MQSFHRQNPFRATLKSRTSLTAEHGESATFHITLNIENSGLLYSPGDSVGVFPRNSPCLVEKTTRAMCLSNNQQLPEGITHPSTSVAEYLATKANLSKVTRSLVTLILPQLERSQQKEFLQTLLENEDRCTEYLAQFEIWDFLEEHPHRPLPCAAYLHCLLPLLPRFYSISSSQAYVGNEIHLTVTAVQHSSRSILRAGVASHFLTQLAQPGSTEIPLFLQTSSHFRLPQKPSVPIIMVGPGTGVAPFRSFLQQRLLVESSSAEHHLFFGERHRTTHFYYQEEWAHMQQQGHLRVHSAFSRDQAHKIYVQHRMKEMGKELFDLLEGGAHLYVCGDAKTMAKEVEQTLTEIFQAHGDLNAEAAKHRVRALRKEKRYSRDVY